MLRLVQHSRRSASQFKILRRQPNPVVASHHFTTTTSGCDAESQPTRVASPPPIQVGFTESSGRGVFATRRIGAGELIHTAKPIVSHPSLSSLHTVCYFCLRKLRNQNQSRAQNVSFCSEECREQSRVWLIQRLSLRYFSYIFELWIGTSDYLIAFLPACVYELYLCYLEVGTRLKCLPSVCKWACEKN